MVVDQPSLSHGCARGHGALRDLVLHPAPTRVRQHGGQTHALSETAARSLWGGAVAVGRLHEGGQDLKRCTAGLISSRRRPTPHGAPRVPPGPRCRNPDRAPGRAGTLSLSRTAPAGGENALGQNVGPWTAVEPWTSPDPQKLFRFLLAAGRQLCGDWIMPETFGGGDRKPAPRFSTSTTREQLPFFLKYTAELKGLRPKRITSGWGV